MWSSLPLPSAPSAAGGGGGSIGFATVPGGLGLLDLFVGSIAGLFVCVFVCLFVCLFVYLVAGRRRLRVAGLGPGRFRVQGRVGSEVHLRLDRLRIGRTARVGRDRDRFGGGLGLGFG